VIKINLLTMGCLSVLVGCSSVKPVASQPVIQSTQVTQHQSVTVDKNAIKQSVRFFDMGSFVAINELTSLDGVLTAKANNIYQNKRGDLIFTKDAVLRFKCGTSANATMIEINSNQFSVPVVLQNKDHVPTGCVKYNGAIKLAKFVK
jgi:hypothetical protein